MAGLWTPRNLFEGENTAYSAAWEAVPMEVLVWTPEFRACLIREETKWFILSYVGCEYGRVEEGSEQGCRGRGS